jgi:transposase
MAGQSQVTTNYELLLSEKHIFAKDALSASPESAEIASDASADGGGPNICQANNGGQFSGRTMPRKMRRFSRETKLAAVQRMLAGENVQALSRELNVLRKDLYKWRASFLSGGPAALRGPGRPPKQTAEGTAGQATGERQPATFKAHRRIAELERKIMHQQAELESIRQAMRQIREKKPGFDDPSARSAAPTSRRPRSRGRRQY